MRISQAQLDAIARNALLDKLERGFRASVPDADLLESPPLHDFLVACEQDAQALGLSSEQGIASYALAAWFLGPGFVDRSRYLRQLLASPYPEVRKVHALNEWVHALLGKPQDEEGADLALRQAFFSTAAWGVGD